jgi:hypothetical protein
MEAVVTSDLPAAAEPWQSIWGLRLLLLAVVYLAVRGIRRVWRKP